LTRKNPSFKIKVARWLGTLIGSSPRLAQIRSSVLRLTKTDLLSAEKLG